MKIQEMRSGILHLTKKMEDERQENYFELQVPAPEVSVPETAAPIEKVSELEEPLWAVVSFERTEASGLTYTEAAALMSELDRRKVAGLCLVTSEAAERVRS